MERNEIILDLENDNNVGLCDRHFDKSGKFKHKTSNQYRLFPFNTKWSPSCYNEFVYFNGILGEIYRSFYKVKLPKKMQNSEYDYSLKQEIIAKASSMTETSDEFMRKKFEQFASTLLFEGNSLFCFDKSIFPYLSFKNGHATLKQISSFIREIFLVSDSSEGESGKNKSTNILYQLIKKSLPKLEEEEKKDVEYVVWNKEIVEIFQKDYEFLETQEKTFLSKVDLLLKHYYFIYISKIALNLNDFCNPKSHPLYFLMETEIVSKNREGFRRGWNMLDKRLDNIFSHANALELLNYIKVDGKAIGNYKEIKLLHEGLDREGKEELLNRISELETFYKEAITKPKTGWDACYEKLENQIEYTRLESPIEKAIYKFWFVVDFQFRNTQRHKPYKDYSLWFKEFCKANFIKRRGRTGHTLKVDQEMLLFLTKLCIGNESKIRLKKLWEELELRGVNFDESSKMEVVNLFEKINLIEKKSDSGDAQYIRTIL